MKAILLAMSALLMLALTGTIQAHAQTQPQACPNIPPGCPGYVPVPQQQVIPQPQYIPPPIPQYVAPQPQFVPQVQPQGGITLQNLTTALTAALDPINKHLTIIDSQIVNITKKLETPAPIPIPPPLPPPTNSTTPLPPPPPPGQGSGQGSGSSCPTSQGGQQQQGGQQYYPGGQMFYPGNFQGGYHQGGSHSGSHSGGSHRSNGN